MGLENIIYFLCVNPCIYSTQIDQQRVANPMGWVPGPEIYKECWIWKEIFEKLNLDTVRAVFGLRFDRFTPF